MPDSQHTFRLFVLGAGFSAPAGLPVASKLLNPVRQVIRSRFLGYGTTRLDNEIEEYKQFLKDTNPKKKFDFEEFGSWLDWQHTLLLNEDDSDLYATMAGHQLRWGIGGVLHKRTPAEIPKVYLEFARLINPTDSVVTFNYDLLLERALEEVGKPYRRFPMRYEMPERTLVAVDNTKEVTLMKLHGSID